jgi:hypothetical protein
LLISLPELLGLKALKAILAPPVLLVLLVLLEPPVPLDLPELLEPPVLLVQTLPPHTQRALALRWVKAPYKATRATTTPPAA